MMSGLRPIHSVETMTWTSEISGTASSGVTVIAQMPHTVNAAVAVNTRKRLPAHQSMIRPIMFRDSLRRDGELLRTDLPASAPDDHGRVPVAGHHDLPRTPIHAAAGVR